jgi:multimeric flavodoxin WrbA
MKKILGIMGSPRKGGNTHLMLDSLLAAARDAGAQTDTLLLGDLTIAECNGCHACWRTGRCAKNDDMNPLYAKIAASDALVFGTPVYWYGPTALIKAFLDRFVYFNAPGTTPLAGKEAALLIPFEEDDPRAADLIIALFERSLAYLGMNLAGTVTVPGLLKKGEVAERSEIGNLTADLGRRLAAGR